MVVFLRDTLSILTPGLPHRPIHRNRSVSTCEYKKLSYRRETARQLPTSRGGGLDPSVHSPSSGYTYAYGRIRKPQRTSVRTSNVPSVKRTLR